MKTRTLALLLFLSVSSAFGARVMDRTLATVNGQAILQSEFEKNATPVLEQFKRSLPPSEQTPARVAEIKKRILDQMVDDKLLLAEAKAKNIRVSQLEVDDGVKKVRQRFPKDDEFNKELKREGVTFEEFRKNIQDQISVIKLIEQDVKAKIKAPTEGEARELFETLKAVSDDKPLPSGKTATEVDELKALASALEQRFGERVRARHILIRVEPKATKEERDAALKKIKDVQAQLKKGSDFAELAEKYSEDPGSKQRGGDLGYFSKGQMVEAFDKTAFTMSVGQTSDVVTTEFGYHILRVEEKRAASKMNFDDVKDDLREYLFSQRAAKKFEEYLKSLRDKAQIKINQLD
jgi:parvulin-like peptidyl-prolyl isomerase